MGNKNNKKKEKKSIYYQSFLRLRFCELLVGIGSSINDFLLGSVCHHAVGLVTQKDCLLPTC